MKSLAIAQFLVPHASRGRLRGNAPFQVAIRIAPEKLQVSRGFRLRLRGRIEAVPGTESAARCVQPGGSQQRPICVVAAAIDEVAIENSATGETLATWTTGRG